MKLGKTANLEPDIVAQLNGFATEGFDLRQALLEWNSTQKTWNLPHDHSQMVLARAYHAAISIYHSGTYDYFRIWDAYGVVTPRLERAEIKMHVATILDTCEYAVRHTRIAGLMLLTPLRIAGARANTQHARGRILALLSTIRQTYRAASAIETALESVWANSASRRELGGST